MKQPTNWISKTLGGLGGLLFFGLIIALLAAGLIYFSNRSYEADQMTRTLRGQETLLHDENIKLKSMNDRLQAEIIELRQALRAREAALQERPLELPPAAKPTTSVVAEPKSESKPSPAAEIIKNAKAKLKPLESAPWSVQIKETDGKIVLTLPIGGWFSPGDVALRPEAIKPATTLAAWISDLPPSSKVEIIGHSDSTPPQGSLANTYKNAIGVSAARARRLADALQNAGKFTAGYFHVVGAGDSKPILPNTTKENRELNRRIELIIQP